MKVPLRFLGFRAFRVRVAGFGVRGGFRNDIGLMVWGLGLKVCGLGFRS